MIEEILYMNGYGIYVWSAFFFTLISFTTLYVIIKIQYIKEKNKFVTKFGALDSEKAERARLQIINKEILSSSQSI
jgi:heme exporter protein D